MTPQESFQETFKVPHETIHSLMAYEGALKRWNEKFNLIAESTLPQIWDRHFADSAQLMRYIPGGVKVLADIGTGAGFPGLVLAIMAQTAKPARDIEFHLVESIGKKADFLQAVAEELKLAVKIRRDRVENIKNLKADVVTARAVKALPELLSYAARLLDKDSLCLFLKGKKLDEELVEAKKNWAFDSFVHPSLTDPSGRVLVLSNPVYKSWTKPKKAGH